MSLYSVGATTWVEESVTKELIVHHCIYIMTQILNIILQCTTIRLLILQTAFICNLFVCALGGDPMTIARDFSTFNFVWFMRRRVIFTTSISL